MVIVGLVPLVHHHADDDDGDAMLMMMRIKRMLKYAKRFLYCKKF